MARKFKSEEEAIKVLEDYGVGIQPFLTIYPPDHVYGGDKSNDDFWAAFRYLCIEHEYVNGNNTPIVGIDFEEL